MAPSDGDGDRTFSQADVNRFLAEERRKLNERYADYDDLKTAAAAAESTKTKMDQVLEKLTAAEKRASDAEAATLRRDVADELGLTAKQARRLAGATRDELLADGREMIEDMGIKPGKRVAGKVAALAGETDDDDTDERDDEDEDEQVIEETQRPPARRTARPREDLRSGAPRTQAAPEETDPGKLAALIPRR